MSSSAVLGTWTGTGATGTGEGLGQLITIVPQLDAVDVTDDLQTFLFVTYDSQVRSVLKSGPFSLVSWQNDSRDEVTGTAVLLHVDGIPLQDDPVVLQLVLPPQGPVRWRAVAVRVSGRLGSAGAVRWTSSVDVPGQEAGGLGLLFFGSTGAPLEYADTSMGKVVDFRDDGTGDGASIEVLAWEPGALGLYVGGGPWYTVGVSVFVPQPPPEPEPERPPPVDADTFWSGRACCECADVFVINDDAVASTWDLPSSFVEEDEYGRLHLKSGDSLLLNYTDVDGTRWSLTDIDGWWTLPPPELPELKRSGYLDGSFPVDGRYNAREITVSGAFLPGDDVSVAVPRQRLLRALDAVRGGALFVVKEPVWAKQSWVYLTGQPKLSTKTRSQLTIFEFTLRAIDPIKYHAGSEGLKRITIHNVSGDYLGRSYAGTAVGGAYPEEEVLRGQRFRPVEEPPPFGDPSAAPNPWRRYEDEVQATAAVAVNAGTARVFPRFYIHGPCANPVLVNETTGQEMRFTGSVDAGEMLVVDCYWRMVLSRAAEPTVSLNPLGDLRGANRRWYLDFMSQWIGLAPGRNVVRWSASTTGEGSKVVLAFRSGWMG